MKVYIKPKYEILSVNNGLCTLSYTPIKKDGDRIIHKLDEFNGVKEVITEYGLNGNDVIFDDKSIDRISIRYKYEEVCYYL